MKKPAGYVFVERNFGSGFRKAGPPLPAWQAALWNWRLRDMPPEGIRHGWYVTLIARTLPDVDCMDPRADGRRPVIACRIAVPYRIDVDTDAARRWIAACLQVAASVPCQGEHPELGIPVPEEILLTGSEGKSEWRTALRQVAGWLLARWRGVAVASVAVLFSVLALGMAWALASDLRHRPPPRPPPEYLDAIYSQLDAWRLDGVDPSVLGTPVALEIGRASCRERVFVCG